jgi:hypothetical protein
MRVTTGPEPALTRSARGSARKGARPACSFAYALKGDRRRRAIHPPNTGGSSEPATETLMETFGTPSAKR